MKHYVVLDSRKRPRHQEGKFVELSLTKTIPINFPGMKLNVQDGGIVRKISPSITFASLPYFTPIQLRSHRIYYHGHGFKYAGNSQK